MNREIVSVKKSTMPKAYYDWKKNAKVKSKEETNRKINNLRIQAATKNKDVKKQGKANAGDINMSNKDRHETMGKCKSNSRFYDAYDIKLNRLEGVSAREDSGKDVSYESSHEEDFEPLANTTYQDENVDKTDGKNDEDIDHNVLENTSGILDVKQDNVYSNQETSEKLTRTVEYTEESLNNTNDRNDKDEEQIENICRSWDINSVEMGEVQAKVAAYEKQVIQVSANLDDHYV